MNVTAEKTVGEMVRKSAAAERVFEKFGIDYCCGGKRLLEEACNTAGVQVGKVLASLEAASEGPAQNQSDRDWQGEPLSELISHIVRTHHKYTRDEIARLGPLFNRVCSVHDKEHPELESMRSIFQGLAQELTMHMMKEEMVLFPYIERMEEAVIQKEPILPPPFGTVQNPVRMMEHEHDSAGKAMRGLRETSLGYSAPVDACISFRTLYQTLEQFEADLHQHIHLENNILFPRAIQMERR